MEPAGRRISAAAARSHTRRKSQSSSSFSIPTGFFKKLSITLLVGFLALFYQAIQPPQPRICGSPNGPPITSPRVKLKDGRHISYFETGAPKEKAKYQFVFLHGLSSCKYDALSLSKGAKYRVDQICYLFDTGLKETSDEYGIYMLSFDRPGYGESDPHPSRSVKSNAQDIEELADLLELGDKFYVVGHSLGGALVWGCLKYIPHRIAGAVLVAPASNSYWHNFPTNITNQAFSQKPRPVQWAFRVAHYAPWLTYWWNTQEWFPSFTSLSQRFDINNAEFTEFRRCTEQARQQGVFESLHRDMNIAMSNWEFDPMDLDNPIPDKEGMIHIWQGGEDRIVSVDLARFISRKISWIKYHEVPNAGHMLGLGDGMGERILKALIVGEDLG